MFICQDSAACVMPNTIRSTWVGPGATCHSPLVTFRQGHRLGGLAGQMFPPPTLRPRRPIEFRLFLRMAGVGGKRVLHLARAIRLHYGASVATVVNAVDLMNTRLRATYHSRLIFPKLAPNRIVRKFQVFLLIPGATIGRRRLRYCNWKAWKLGADIASLFVAAKP